MASPGFEVADQMSECCAPDPGRVAAPWWAIRTAFTLSGASGLIFELVWSRQLAVLLGVSAWAISAVLTLFMAGLALGALLGGRWAGRWGCPLRAYALLELCIGASTLAVTPALRELGPLWQAHISTAAGIGPAGLNPLDLLFAGLLLLPPTTLMGMTLPILAEGVPASEPRRERSVGLLYALNTTGAVLGTAAGGLLLMPWLGLQTTAWCASLLNLAIGTAVLLLLRLRPRDADASTPAQPLDLPRNIAGIPTDRPATEQVPPGPDESEVWTDQPEDRPGATPTSGPASSSLLRRLILLAVLTGSATAMAYQVLWTRALAVVLGSSTYSFTLILVAFLVGLAGGGYLATWLLPRIRGPLLALSGARWLVALAAAPCLLFFDWLPILELSFLRWASPQPLVVLGFVFLLAVGVVLLPTMAMGAAFPLALTAFVARREHGLGRQVGFLYAASTTGSILGSAVAGFLLLPLLGLRWSITACLALDLIFAALLAGAAWLQLRRPVPALLAGAACASLLLLPLVLPRWDQARFTSGMFRVSLVREEYMDDEYSTGKLLLYKDGVAATVSVEQRGDVLILRSNGKVEASSRADMPTQILVALLPLILHSQPREVLLVGLASGVTAGAALVTDLRTLTVAELEPAMLEATRLFAAHNRSPFADRRFRLVAADGRNYIARTPERFDVIVSEPSNPWISGVSSLFTLEAFTAARDRLAPDGIFCQWLQLYEMAPENVEMILRTFARVFPHGLVFTSSEQGVDLLLLGARGPITLDLPSIKSRLAQPTIRDEAARAGISGAAELLALLVLDLATDRELHQPGLINTDDNAALEYRAPLDLIAYDRHEGSIRKFYQRARRLTRLTPLLQGVAPSDLGELALARLATNHRQEARSLVATLAADDPSRQRLLLLDALADEELTNLEAPLDHRLPRTIRGVARHKLARFWELVRRDMLAEATDLLGSLPEQAGLDPSYSILAAYVFLLDGLNHSAIEILRKIAGHQGGPVAGYLLGRALIESGESREGMRWLNWSLDAGLELPPDLSAEFE